MRDTRVALTFDFDNSLPEAASLPSSHLAPGVKRV